MQSKLLAQRGELYGVKAISPKGKVYDIKGVKMTDQEVAAKINGVPVHAHVKALPPVHGSAN